MLPNGKRIIDTLISSALASNAENVVLVTPDVELADTITACPVYVWGGKRDVLGEFWFAAKDFEDDIIRLTGDCPLLTPEVINSVLNEYIWQEVDYVCNTHDDDPMCDGYDVEVFSFKSLKEANLRAERDYDREHVTPWIRRNYKTGFCPMPEMEGCSIDTLEDYLEVCKIMEK